MLRARSGWWGPRRARSGRDAAADGAGRGARPHPALRREPGHRDARLRGPRAGRPVRRHAGPVPGGRLPGPVKYGYLNVGVVEEGPAHLLGRTVFCLYPHQTRLRRPRRARCRWCPTACRPSGPCSPARSRPPSTRSGTRRRSSVTGSRSSGPAWWAAASPACWPASPASQVTLVDVDPTRADGGGGAGRRLRRCRDAADAAGRLRPRRPHQRHVGRAAARPRPAGRRGHRARPQLVRRPRGPAVASAGRSTPADCGIRASQVGAVAPARRASATHADRLALALDLLRDPAFDALLTGPVAASTSCPTVMARLADGEPAGDLPHRSPTTEG